MTENRGSRDGFHCPKPAARLVDITSTSTPTVDDHRSRGSDDYALSADDNRLQEREFRLTEWSFTSLPPPAHPASETEESNRQILIGSAIAVFPYHVFQLRQRNSFTSYNELFHGTWMPIKQRPNRGTASFIIFEEKKRRGKFWTSGKSWFGVNVNKCDHSIVSNGNGP